MKLHGEDFLVTLPERKKKFVSGYERKKKVCRGEKNHSPPQHIIWSAPKHFISSLACACGRHCHGGHGSKHTPPWAWCHTIIGPAVRADFRRLYPANAKTPTCCPKRRQSHQGDKLCDVSTVPLVASWPVFMARGSGADGEPHYDSVRMLKTVAFPWTPCQS